MGKLYVVATPIGNLEDISLRALKVLAEVNLIVAEDTRRTRKILSHFKIRYNKLTSYNQHNSTKRIPSILKVLEQNDVAMVSDAGAPVISDPGFHLVKEANLRGFTCIPIPGASAVITALSVAGFPGDSFLFLGFLPRSKRIRRSLLQPIAELKHTLVIFEAPHRLSQTLEDLMITLGDREITVCRELTKLHEEIYKGLISEASIKFAQPRGEFTLVIAGNLTQDKSQPQDFEGAKELLTALKIEGISREEAIAQLSSAFGMSRRAAYRMWIANN
jgi:16S rRNA (cytidine1402-2'-O)-methyltransferase